MKRYDSGIKDLSLEIIDNYIKNNNLYDNQNNYQNIIFQKISYLFSWIKNKFNKQNQNEINAYMIKKINREYFKDEYLELLECNEETNDEKKFREVIQKQQSIGLNNEKKILNKDQTMMEIVYELDLFYDAYNLPELNITNKEWDIFFNKTYNLFIKYGIEAKYCEYMQSITRYTLAKSLVYENIEINKNDFIEALNYLKVCDDFNVEDINKLQNELNIVLKNNKITSFNDYKRRLTKN